MRVLPVVAVPVAVLLAASPAGAETGPSALVDHTEWVRWDGKPSLRVYPTPAGRAAAGALDTDGGPAWAEVLALAPDADTPGMYAQFQCHWRWAELAEPGKTSWNLEPWRPVVDEATMTAAGCNPGSAEEPF